MEKDQNISPENLNSKEEKATIEEKDNNIEQDVAAKSEETKELTPEDKIIELEDKIARTFAEMENQRRRFEKEREDAFSYGGFAFAKETLNLIDNFERSKEILKNDEVLKDTEALKKNLRTF